MRAYGCYMMIWFYDDMILWNDSMMTWLNDEMILWFYDDMRFRFFYCHRFFKCAYIQKAWDAYFPRLLNRNDSMMMTWWYNMMMRWFYDMIAWWSDDMILWCDDVMMWWTHLHSLPPAAPPRRRAGGAPGPRPPKLRSEQASLSRPSARITHGNRTSIKLN